MSKLIKNEFKLFLNTKALICFVISFLGLLFIYNNYFIPKYENYYDSISRIFESRLLMVNSAIESISVDIRDLDSAIKESDGNISNLQNKRTQLGNIRYKYEKVSKHITSIAEGSNLPEFEKDYDDYMEEIDNYIKNYFIEPIKEEGDDFYHYGYALSNELDWANRILQRQYREDNGYDVRLGEITSSRFIEFLYDGDNITYIVFSLLLIIVLNFDNWSKEISENDGKLILTIPHKREKIFFARFFVRLFLSLFIIFLPIIFVFIYTTIKYKFCGSIGINVSENLFSGSLSNEVLLERINDLRFLELNKVIPIWKYNLLIVLFYVFFIAFTYSLINLIDVVFKISEFSIIFGIILLFILIFGENVSITNPLSYYKMSEIIFGIKSGYNSYEVIQYGYETFLLITILLSILIYFVTREVFVRRKI